MHANDSYLANLEENGNTEKWKSEARPTIARLDFNKTV